MRTQKVLVVILACLVSGDASAGLCEMQLQEEANVFEVNCFLDLSRCHVAGYFTHPRLSPGHNGLVASLSKAPPKKRTTQSIRRCLSSTPIVMAQRE